MNLPGLYTSFWSNRDLRHMDATMVSISRGQPKWPLPFRYRRATLLAPSRETFEIRDDAAFERSYLAGLEAEGTEKIAAMLRKISDEQGGRALILLCWEKPGELCHRRMFSRWFEGKTGIAVPELGRGCGASRKRQDAQPSLFDEGRGV